MSVESSAFNVERSGSAGRAVFLSYARDDAAAARRIAEALRASGLEVWFDENELRGGDTWDTKIRQQIDACGLFVAVISRHTQDRSKGYFRLEWKLAVDQTHLLAAGVPFIAPVVIDDTPENGAVVPPEFLKVQWTRLPGALPTPQFVGQVQRLLSGPHESGGRDLRIPPPTSSAGSGDPALQRKPANPGWAWGALAAVVVGVAAALYVSHQPKPAAPAEPPRVAAAEKPPAPAASAAAPVDAKSIAVLPFANLSTEKENEFFADGVHDDVITNLAKIRDLKVISRTSVLAYRDPASRNLKKIAAELGVATILEGSIRRVGTKVHMNAQLIDARTDEHLWADTFDGDTADIFALQASLAQKIAGALKATLTPGEKSLIERRPTQNQEAYDLYLRARAMLQERGEKGTVAEYEHIVAVFEKAIAKDPSFALAYTQVAIVHSILYWFGYLDPTPARAAKMKAAVDAAVRLAPDDPETHLALGAYQYRVKLAWAAALKEFRQAETGLPNDAQLRFWLAITHRRIGRWTEALDFFRQSVGLNPRDYAPVQNYALFLVNMRHWKEGADESARFLNYFPADSNLLLVQAAAQFALNGDRMGYAAAIESLPRSPADPTGAGAAYEAAVTRGDYPAADRILANSNLNSFMELGSSVINDPVAMFRARMADYRGDAAAARQFAAEALKYYRESSWNLRQQMWVRMRIALAEAWSGQVTEALRDGPAAMTDALAQDRYDAASLRQGLGELYISLDRREEALATLRAMMGEPGDDSPSLIRINPLWSRLKDDPRFEEILQSAKPL